MKNNLHGQITIAKTPSPDVCSAVTADSNWWIFPFVFSCQKLQSQRLINNLSMNSKCWKGSVCFRVSLRCINLVFCLIKSSFPSCEHSLWYNIYPMDLSSLYHSSGLCYSIKSKLIHNEGTTWLFDQKNTVLSAWCCISELPKVHPPDKLFLFYG